MSGTEDKLIRSSSVLLKPNVWSSETDTKRQPYRGLETLLMIT